jgi:hypothetical protein
MHLLKDRGFIHPVASDITPQRVYAQRRQLLKALAAGAGGASLAAFAARDALAMTAGSGKLPKLPGAHDGKGHVLPGRQHLQQLLRVRHRQGRSGAQRPHAEDPPWTVASRAR